MKKAILLTILSIITISCNNDDNSQNPSDNNQILKLKEYRGMDYKTYYYNQNGFVDSISVIGGGMLPTNIQTKFHFNSENKLVSTERWIQIVIHEESFYENDIYEYNTENLISIKKTFDENNSLIRTANYSYNSDGYLTYGNQTYSNGNLVQDNGIIYTYDNNKNPFYDLYPLAYIRMNQINKNNTLTSGNSSEIFLSFTYFYNENSYPISYQMTPGIADLEDQAQYIYY